MTLMTQKWKSQLYFETFIFNLNFYRKRWKMCEQKVRSESLPKGRAEKGQKCQSVFLGKTFPWQNFVIFMKSKKITAEVMFSLRMNKSCKVESCYPVQKC